MAAPVIRVAVVDDQDLIREGIAQILRSAGDIEVVLLGRDGRDLVDAVAGQPPMDVALVDLSMPEMDGLAATRMVAGQPGAPAVVILSTFGDEDNVVAALRAGARGFLLKRSTGPALIEAVRAAADGESVLAPQITRAVIERMLSTADLPSGPLVVSGLSPRELDVLRCLGSGATNSEIASELHLSESTVKTHVSRVMAKIGARDRVGAALIAVRSGLTPN